MKSRLSGDYSEYTVNGTTLKPITYYTGAVNWRDDAVMPGACKP